MYIYIYLCIYLYNILVLASKTTNHQFCWHCCVSFACFLPFHVDAINCVSGARRGPWDHSPKHSELGQWGHLHHVRCKSANWFGSLYKQHQVGWDQNISPNSHELHELHAAISWKFPLARKAAPLSWPSLHTGRYSWPWPCPAYCMERHKWPTNMGNMLFFISTVRCLFSPLVIIAGKSR